VLINKYTVAVTAERERREGNKPMGFFKHPANSKKSGEFLKASNFLNRQDRRLKKFMSMG
tara:strand:+ start:928 stop:1107 length:180 start_codon:yes stop_codon:yes gene_type:complete